MATTTTDRLRSSGNLGMKAPCVVSTTANVTLSGLQTIDGVTVTDAQRILVRSQTTASENGIYLASSTAWVRSPDWNGEFDTADGTLIYVTDGTVGGNTIWRCSATNPVSVGTDSVTFEIAAPITVSAFIQTLLDDTTAAAARATLGAAYVDANGRLLVGVSASVDSGSHLHGFGELSAQLHEVSNARNLGLFRYGSGTHGAALVLLTSEGVVGAPTAVSSGAGIGQLVASGFHTGAWVTGARFTAKVDGTPGALDMPGRWEFETTPDGGQDSVYRGRIDSSGRIIWNHTAAISTPGSADSALMHLVGESNNRAGLDIAEFQSSIGGIGPHISFFRAKTATIGGQGLLASSDSLGGVFWSYSDGVQARQAARITAIAGPGTLGAGDTPASIVIGVTADGASTPTDYVALDHTGAWMPWADDLYDLGKSSNRWDDVYATNGTIQTSDVSQKRDVKPAVLGLDFLLKADVITFKWADVDLPAVTETRTERRAKVENYEKVEVGEIVEEIGGKLIARKVETAATKSRPVGKTVPLHGPDGEELYTVELREGPDGEPVEVKTLRTVFVPEYEDVEVEVEVTPARKKTHRRDHIGFDAQQLKGLLDEIGVDVGLVTVDPDTGLHGIRMGEMVAVLAQSIKELAAKVAALEAGK